MVMDPDMTRRPPSHRTNASVNCTIMKMNPIKDPLATAIWFYTAPITNRDVSTKLSTGQAGQSWAHYRSS